MVKFRERIGLKSGKLPFIDQKGLSDRIRLNALRSKTRSQVLQELFVLAETDLKTGGYFVEFGATDGLTHSNTYLLEKEFGWSGLLAEPAKVWHDQLRANRTCTIETDCVWSRSDEVLSFNEAIDPVLSTLTPYSESDEHAGARENGEIYEVRTVSLNDLLVRHEAPRDIDYLSIDTEGSELEILNEFDFERWNVRIFTCEHNFTDSRKPIQDLMARHGYRHVHEKNSLFDDWFVKD